MKGTEIMNLFDILGPVMVGPSSSHTAGAVRIGYVARQLLSDVPVRAKIYMHGSFAETGAGHGTDRALVAGLLGMQPDDMKIPDSFREAEKAGLSFSFENRTIPDAHPNTALLEINGASGKHLSIQACSLGGGRILINKMDDIEVNCSGECPTLIVHNEDHPGHVAAVTSLLSMEHINIASMSLYRHKRGGRAVMVLEVDQDIPEVSLQQIEHIQGIIKVTYINISHSES